MFNTIRNTIKNFFSKTRGQLIHDSFTIGDKCYKKRWVDIEIVNKMITYHAKYHSRTLCKNVIVSLTSHTPRLPLIHATLFSLISQSIGPSKIILILEDENEKNSIHYLDIFKKYNLEIQNGNEYKAYNKLIPVMLRYPDAVIVTADDDIYYENYWLQSLLKSYDEDKLAIHAHRTRSVSIQNNKILSYKKWKINTQNNTSYLNFLTGVGGVLYPPHSLYHDFHRKDLYSLASPYNDDIWFWAMCLLNKRKIKNIGSSDNLIYTNPFNEINAIDTLATHNNRKNYNDMQIERIFELYPELCEIIQS